MTIDLIVAEMFQSDPKWPKWTDWSTNWKTIDWQLAWLKITCLCPACFTCCCRNIDANMITMVTTLYQYWAKHFTCLQKSSQKAYMNPSETHNNSCPLSLLLKPHIPAAAGASKESCAWLLSLSAQTHDCSTWLAQGWITAWLACSHHPVPADSWALHWRSHPKHCLTPRAGHEKTVHYLDSFGTLFWWFTEGVWQKNHTEIWQISHVCSCITLT